MLLSEWFLLPEENGSELILLVCDESTRKISLEASGILLLSGILLTIWANSFS